MPRRRPYLFGAPCGCNNPYVTCTESDHPRILVMIMADTTALYALRFPDGSVSLYIDEQYAKERGVDLAQLVRVEIPRDMFVTGSVQDVREYVALYLEAHHRQAGSA